MHRMATKLFAPVLSAVLLGLLMVAFRYGPTLLEEEWLTQARAAHGQWVETAQVADGRVLAPRNYLSGLRQIGAVPHLTDLTGAGLSIDQVSIVSKSRGRPDAIHVAYADRAGCRLSLWIVPTEDGKSGTLQRHGTEAFSWHADGLRYVLVTSDMEFDRFHLIAKTSRAATKARRGPDGTAYAALGFSAMISRPC